MLEYFCLDWVIRIGNLTECFYADFPTVAIDLPTSIASGSSSTSSSSSSTSGVLVVVLPVCLSSLCGKIHCIKNAPDQ